jgi:hypothetical protein
MHVALNAFEGLTWESRARVLLAAAQVSLPADTGAFLQQIRAALEALDPRRLESPDEIAGLLKSQKLFSGDLEPVHLDQMRLHSVAYLAPSRVALVGSYALGTAVALPEPPLVDVAFEVPRKFLLEKDYLDGRYHVRRLVYLAEVVRQLRDRVPDLEATWVPSNSFTRSENPLLHAALQKPVVVLSSPKVSGRIRLLPALTPDKFPKLMQRPELYCFRAFQDLPQENERIALNTHYVNSIRSDWSIWADFDLLVATTKRYAIVSDCVRLLKLWSANRQLTLIEPVEAARRLVSGHELALQTAQLVEQGEYPAHAASLSRLVLAVFRAIRARLPVEPSIVRVEVEAALRSFASRLRELDQVGGIYYTLAGCCMEPLAYFDSILQVTQRRSAKRNPRDATLDTLRGEWLQRVFRTLRRALGDRVAYLGVLPRRQHANTNFVQVGIKWQPQNMLRTIDRDPDEQFWGSGRLEWRRFRSGEILHCLVWAESSIERFQIPQRIVDAALKKEPDAQAKGNTLWLLEERHTPGLWTREHLDLRRWRYVKDPRSLALYQTRCVLLGKMYQALCQLLMDADGAIGISKVLPLRVQAVHVAVNDGEWLRHTAVEWPELQENLQGRWASRYRLTAHVELESTHLWPDATESADAAQAVRVAFTIALYRALKRGLRKHAERLPVPVRFIQATRHGDLLLLLGCFPIRLRVCSAAEAVSMSAAFRLHAQLSSISSRFPAFGPTARLAKRFLAAHGLVDLAGIDGLSPAAVELLLSRLFTDPLPWGDCPATAWGGLVRFLHLIAKTETALTEPLVIPILNLSEDEPPWYPETGGLESSVASKHCWLRLCTASDPCGTLLTKQVAAEVVRRMRLVCRAALQHLGDALHQDGGLEPDHLGVIFRPPPLASFCDLVLELEHALVPEQVIVDSGLGVADREVHAPDELRQRFGIADATTEQWLVGFDPIGMYLRWLREMFGDLWVFLYDAYGGRWIGGIWRSAASQPALSLDVSRTSYRRVVKSGARIPADTRLEWNLPEILHDMHAVGAGLVREIRLCGQLTGACSGY